MRKLLLLGLTLGMISCSNEIVVEKEGSGEETPNSGTLPMNPDTPPASTYFPYETYFHRSHCYLTDAESRIIQYEDNITESGIDRNLTPSLSPWILFRQDSIFYGLTQLAHVSQSLGIRMWNIYFNINEKECWLQPDSYQIDSKGIILPSRKNLSYKNDYQYRIKNCSKDSLVLIQLNDSIDWSGKEYLIEYVFYPQIPDTILIFGSNEEMQKKLEERILIEDMRQL